MRTYEELLSLIALEKIAPCPAGDNCVEHQDHPPKGAPGRLLNPYHPFKTGHKTFSAYMDCVGQAVVIGFGTQRGGWNKSLAEVEAMNGWDLPKEAQRRLVEKFDFQLCSQWFEIIHKVKEYLPEIIQFYFANVGTRIIIDLGTARRIIEQATGERKTWQASKSLPESGSHSTQMTLPMPNEKSEPSSSTP